MNDHRTSHFSDGFILGIIVGAAAVFLFGTKSGKNLVKIFNEQGIDGIKDLIDQYNEGVMEEDLEEEPEIVDDLKSEKVEHTAAKETNHVDHVNGVKESTKRRFFKRK